MTKRIDKSTFEKSIKKLGLGENATEVALDAYSKGKSHKKFDGRNGKVSDINVRICFTENVLTINKKITRQKRVLTNDENIYQLA